MRREDEALDLLQNIFLVPPSAATPLASTAHMTGSVSHPHHTRRMSSTTARRRTAGGGAVSLERSESGSSIGQPALSTGAYGRRHGHERTSSALTATSVGTVTNNGRPRKKSIAASSAITTGTYSSAGFLNITHPLQVMGQPSSPSTSRRPPSAGLLSAWDGDHDSASIRALRPESAHGLHIETNPPTPTTPVVNLPSSTFPGEREKAVRLPHALVISRVEKAKPSVQRAIADVLRSGRVVLSPKSGKETWEDEEDEEDHERAEETAWNLPTGFLVVYVSPMGDGTGREGTVDRNLVSSSQAL